MSEATAKTATDWFLEASFQVKDLYINFMGGEPLLEFDLIRKIVPYGKRRGLIFGKSIQFSATTNLTLLTEEILNFWDEWGMGWLVSIDGCPEIQDEQRPFADGTGSSDVVQEKAKMLLKHRPHQHVRTTFTSHNVNDLYKNFLYLVNLGFSHIILSMGDPPHFEEHHLKILDNQLRLIKNLIVQSFKSNTKVVLRIFEYYLIELVIKKQNEVNELPMSCGAGRGMVLVDPDGNIWPCHRFDSAAKDFSHEETFLMGNIYQSFNHKLHNFFLYFSHFRHHKTECPSCDLYKLCGGGCPAANVSYSQNPYLKHSADCLFDKMALKHTRQLYEELKSNTLFQKHINETRYLARRKSNEDN